MSNVYFVKKEKQNKIVDRKKNNNSFSVLDTALQLK